ncbi:MAG: lysophospholipase [Treponema sp.]|jgi:alpha-beta hydrolase superfamily lysophospholipase|nr:lysophospholipase [Treponema sp.]
MDSLKTLETNTPDKWENESGESCSTQWLTADDGVKLFVRSWIPRPAVPLRAIVHIVHGMAEHSLRYERLALRLNTAGIAVWAADMRGHGKTADLSVNDAARGGLLGHCADKDAISRIAADIDALNRAIGKQYPHTPLFLLGHSWGSFLAQNYIEAYGNRLAGCILSGTRGPDGLKIRAGVPLMTTLAALHGRKGSFLARALADGPYSRPFKPIRTAFDWLSRDEKEVDAYIADPFCGKLCSSVFYRDLLVLLNKIHKPEALAAIKRELPIYIFGGSTDPAGDMGNSPTALVNAYRSIGIQDLEFVLYPDARHETLNETNREEVTENLLAWILKHC